MLIRPMRDGPGMLDGTRSIARTSSALGGPPCWNPGDHGPSVSSVANYESGPFGRK
jgi:hypothetical protein